MFSSVTQSCPTLCDPMDCSTPGFSVHHQLLEFAQTCVLRVGDAIQPSHPLSSFLLPPSIFPSIRVFSSESVLHIRWPNVGASAFASVLPINIQDWFPLGLTALILQSKGLSRVFCNTTVQKHQCFAAQLSLCYICWNESPQKLMFPSDTEQQVRIRIWTQIWWPQCYSENCKIYKSIE